MRFLDQVAFCRFHERACLQNVEENEDTLLKTSLS